MVAKLDLVAVADPANLVVQVPAWVGRANLGVAGGGEQESGLKQRHRLQRAVEAQERPEYH